MADSKVTALSAIASVAGEDLIYIVDDPAGTPTSKKATVTQLATFLGTGGATAPLYFFPASNEPPSSNFATLDMRSNGHPVLDFDDTTAEAAIFTGVLMPGYASGGITVKVAYSTTSAITGTAGWTIEIERIGDSQLDVDGDSFASAQTITAVTVPGTTGFVDVVSVNISDGANMDSVAAGEQFRIRIKRDTATDTAAGDTEFHWMSVEEQ